MSNWTDLLMKAKPLVEFLGRHEYFHRAYSGDRVENLVITDASLGMEFAINDSFEKFDEWETVSDSIHLFPEEFEWKRWIDAGLLKNNYFGLCERNFHGAELKLSVDGVCPLLELMHRDMRILLNCYANEIFPAIWMKIESAYFSDGFPCGWDGRYPVGKLVVYSNEPAQMKNI
ncbi:hypothetical protein NU688_07960 [Variovorax sp. ZS18.2.2]|uniref:hypothetical protein n=1 Tax=Variovorax sp. ZS18.2.2 TaxID=2971255 RepID=UPI0021513593|nr:hypothetical protein [Variovorax sp. ZS18.2.2]MCR6476087.1 hypothetical protein [Variovorax sp. ZS18.2.2]